MVLDKMHSTLTYHPHGVTSSAEVLMHIAFNPLILAKDEALLGGQPPRPPDGGRSASPIPPTQRSA